MWIELRPLRKAGCPRTIVSDNDRQFIGKEVARLCTELHIQQRLTPTYTPQCNPMERANQVIKTMVAQNIGKTQKTWKYG